MPQLAASVENVPHSRIRELAEIAMGMDGVLRLYFGESNLPTPDYIKRAAVQAFASQMRSDASTGAGPVLRATTIAREQRAYEVMFL